jgi:hypothetical protein
VVGGPADRGPGATTSAAHGVVERGAIPDGGPVTDDVTKDIAMHPSAPLLRRARALAVGLAATTLIAACGTADAADEAGGAPTPRPPGPTTTTSTTATTSAPERPTTTTTPVPALDGPVDATGALADGATWHIEAPADWDGTLVVYGHGLVPPGQDNPATDAPDPLTAAALLDRGWAIAGTSYATTGFALAAALEDQTALLDVFAAEVGEPTSTIAWGQSLGGVLTAALLEREPDRFDGGVAMCGVLGGTVALADQYLDLVFVLRELLAPGAFAVSGGDDPQAAVDVLGSAAVAAQGTPAGRARLALAAAVAGIPAWAGAGSPRPDAADVGSQQAALFDNLGTVAPFAVFLRAELAGRFGGEPATNVGVDYAALLAGSDAAGTVAALYERAGLDLDADLAALAAADRVTADPAARAAAAELVTLDGGLEDPLLTLHDEGDALATAQHERAYADAVVRAGSQDLLRQVWTARAGHCIFTPAETVAALDVVVDRIETGSWPSTGAAAMNARAEALGADLNVHLEDGSDEAIPTPPGFGEVTPGPLPGPRPR